MKDVQDQELSGLLDGELSAARAAEVRARIEADPRLRREYEALVRLDAQLCRTAEDATFVPDMSLRMRATRETSSPQWPVAVAIVLALVAIRFLPKFAEASLLGLGLQLLAGAVIVFQIIRMVHDTAPSSTVAIPGA